MEQRLLTILAAGLMLITSIAAPAAAGMAYSTPPGWMPMTMPAVTYDSETNKLAVADSGINAPLGTNTNSANGNPAPGIAGFDPAQPFAVLNGTAFSRRLGWYDPNEADSGNTILDKIKTKYGPDAGLWIQSMTKSSGLNTYLAVGNFGVNADGSLTVDTMNPTGIPYSQIIYGTFPASTTKWRWDGQMDHNANTVPFSAITKPNQIFSAYYKIYVGDSAGTELLTDRNGVTVASAAATTVWTWQGPPFVFTSQTGVAAGTLLESDIFTYTAASTAIEISGGEYAISTDGGITWGAWAATTGTIADTNKVKVRLTSAATPGATVKTTLAIPTATGPGTFSVTTLGPDTTPDAFTFASQTSAAVSTVTESAVVTISGINAPAAIAISGGDYTISTDNGASWGNWETSPGTVANSNKVKVRLTSAANPGVTATTTLTIGGVSGMFVVTTSNPVAPSLSFTPVTGAPANTSVSGLPYYVVSNPLTVSADSTISITGGITPQYTVSTDSGVTWSAWSTTSPATVTTGNQVKVRVVPATAIFTTAITKLNLGSTVAGFSVTTGYANPPSWMPMAMLNVAFNGTAGTLAVQDENTHASFANGGLPALTSVPAGAYDPDKPWNVLNGGVALSRQLGWDDPTALHGNGITISGGLINQIKAEYGATAGIWIERISQSPGLETYYADGMFGVGGTGNGLSGTPQIYSNPVTGLPNIFADNYYGIFGTNGSPTKWQWNGTMIHNVYAVPAAYITQPNQVFSATYRVYIGDNEGNDIAPEAATTEVWSWKGPATVPDRTPDSFGFPPRIGVAVNTVVESASIIVNGIDSAVPISISAGEYAVSTDAGANWSAYSATVPATVVNGNRVKVRQTSSGVKFTPTTTMLSIGGVTGSFSVTTAPHLPDNSYAVNATVAGTGGVIAPAGKIVKSGATTTFTVKPDYGYDIAGVAGCSGTLSGTHYTTGLIAEACTVTASFTALPMNLTITTKQLVNPLGYKGKSGVIKFDVAGATTREELSASAGSSDSWITSGTLAYDGKGHGNIKFTIPANASNKQRQGNITIAGKIYAISQAGKPGKLTLNPDSTTPLPAAGDSMSVAVAIDPADGGWSVSSVKWGPAATQNWLQGFTVGEAHISNGALNLTSLANTSGKQRSAILTLVSSDGMSRKSITVKQAK